MGSKIVRRCRERLGEEIDLRTDGWRAYGIFAFEHALQVASRSLPPEKADTWLSCVNTATSNLQRFLLGTDHGVSS